MATRAGYRAQPPEAAPNQAAHDEQAQAHDEKGGSGLRMGSGLRYVRVELVYEQHIAL